MSLLFTIIDNDANKLELKIPFYSYGCG